ncbi:hypothetical protein B0H10DRAFT_1960576 [Mycena sp. CBHHK59/15]|nr:hypothetical protein B0H10DRAFT_1960576 [Mycena sp. CBHHK59/15]
MLRGTESSVRVLGVHWQRTHVGVLKSLAKTIAVVVGRKEIFGNVYVHNKYAADGRCTVEHRGEGEVEKMDVKSNQPFVATIFALWKATVEHMRISNLNAAFNAAPPLSLKDVLLTMPELKLMDKCLQHCILRIIVKHGGEKFEKFRKALDTAPPVTPEKIELHQTCFHPLPAWNIDESTILGMQM